MREAPHGKSSKEEEGKEGGLNWRYPTFSEMRGEEEEVGLVLLMMIHFVVHTTHVERGEKDIFCFFSQYVMYPAYGYGCM